MERPVENAQDDPASPQDGGKTATSGSVTMGTTKLWESIKRGAKGSKDTDKPHKAANESASLPLPSSPNPSTSSAVKNKEEPDSSTQKNKSPAHPNAESNIPRRGASIYDRFWGSKKKNKQDPVPLSKGSVEEEEEEEEEMYKPPEIPATPLSMMQINKLIEMEVLEEAHLNLLSLRQEFQREQRQFGDDSPMELSKKEKDLILLYTELRKKLVTIVRDSNSLPSRNKALLVHVVRIIQEEEKRAEEPGGLPDSWKEVWRRAVDDGVKAKVRGVHLETSQQNVSWLAVHLGLLGKSIVEDLDNIRRELKGSYPPSFNVFSTYVNSYCRIIPQHLKTLEEQITEQKDLYALLDWILNRYKSEKIMGSLCLQADMKDESSDLQLDHGFLDTLKNKYCKRVQEDTRCSLKKLIELESEEFWKNRTHPDSEDGFLNSDFHMDVWTIVKGNTTTSRGIDAQLEVDVTSACLLELRHFPKSFESHYRLECDSLRPQPLWIKYHITYINSFTALQKHMEDYRATCPELVEELNEEVKSLNNRLLKDLVQQFKNDVEVNLRRMMTRKWLTNDHDFQQLYDHTQRFSQHCSLMQPPNVQEFADRLHYHVVKEYIGQLMKGNYSCKNRKHEQAANKLREQWRRLQELFNDMNSSQEWLYPVGDELCDIIGQKNSSHIKDHLQVLVKDYPDFRKEHLVAVLYFRGPVQGREHQLILQTLNNLRKNQDGDKSRLLFNDMEVTVNTNCLLTLPSCLHFCLSPRL